MTLIAILIVTNLVFLFLAQLDEAAVALSCLVLDRACEAFRMAESDPHEARFLSRPYELCFRGCR
jgi:hypothetical protein